MKLRAGLYIHHREFSSICAKVLKHLLEDELFEDALDVVSVHGSASAIKLVLIVTTIENFFYFGTPETNNLLLLE